ncbi:DUF7127 family protein [Halococcus saccharolyticus]|uniref:Hsp20/alpha crystallin family protein n=1 Tax=Halococcus saccharolyticus DSM 5350 TaxID=1227455 RepID=M0MFU0_9EURY|nr:hypothetical protein [Halococcus saccharolyticus]EMA44238.1 hypothetical protein C449_11948 [Halococcus saccharolyticus DSM 5350]
MTPKLQQFDERDTGGLRRYEYDDRVVYAVDVGLGEATVDVAGSTVMLVSDDDQAEFEVPESGTVEAAINNGVLTVEVGR